MSKKKVAKSTFIYVKMKNVRPIIKSAFRRKDPQSSVWVVYAF